MDIEKCTINILLLPYTYAHLPPYPRLRRQNHHPQRMDTEYSFFWEIMLYRTQRWIRIYPVCERNQRALRRQVQSSRITWYRIFHLRDWNPFETSEKRRIRITGR